MRQSETKTISLTMAPPATRMLLVEVFKQDGGEFDQQVRPVVSLACRLVEEWCKNTDKREQLPPDPEEAKRAGWFAAGVHEEVGVVVVSDEFPGTLETVYEAGYPISNGDGAFVVATWDPADDVREVAKVVERVKAEFQASYGGSKS